VSSTLLSRLVTPVLYELLPPMPQDVIPFARAKEAPEVAPVPT
jgi:hypothetical protein